MPIAHSPLRAVCVLVAASLLAAAGCGAADPQPMLQSLSAMTASMNEIVTHLEAADLAAVDEVMHGAGFGEPFNTLPVQINKSGLSEGAKITLLGAKDRLLGQLRVIHGSAHGGSIDDLDTEAIVTAINEALADIKAALPTGMDLPASPEPAVFWAYRRPLRGGEQRMDHPYGWLSLAPPLTTVALAIATKRAVLSLLAGLAVGSLILTGGRPLEAAVQLLETHLWSVLVDPWQVRLFAFLILVSAMIGVVNRSGGMHGLVLLVAPLAKTRRRGQLAAWLAGLLVFFDDYTNTLLVGATMRPTTDRLRISREKLAYIVDSTAAPVAGIALLSTWVAVEIAYLEQGVAACPPELVGDYTPLDLFLGCLPYRFYIIQALLFVPMLAILGRDFGPMLHAERRALASGAAAEPANDSVEATHWSNAVLPLGATLATVVALIVQTGRAATQAAEIANPSWRDIFGAADANLALFYGALVGLAVSFALSLGRKLLSYPEACDAAFSGVRVVLPGMAILWLAGALSGMTRDGGEPPTPETGYVNQSTALYTGDYLQRLLPQEGGAAATLLALSLPTTVFLMAAAVAFSTGTSFGTMAILFPVVAPVAFASVGPVAGANASEPLLLATFGAVLSGAIFGDHCSPISDTTVLSSQASGSDHVAHVVTQLPYALTVAAVSVLLGTAPLALGVSVWLLLPLQTAALAAIAWRLGERAADGSSA